MKRKKNNINSWKEKNVHLWEKIVSMYIILKSSPSAKLFFKFIFLILKVTFSIFLKKILLHIFHDFWF